MGRLRNIANAGFYPWLEDHFERVAAQLVGPDDDNRSWMLDPCAGEGVFARFLADRLGLKLATLEINHDRGEQCRAISDHHVTTDALQAECGHHQFAFLWSNPPFMTDAEARMEWRFLRRYRDALAPGGVLAYTIPGRTMLRDKAILAHLVRFYRDHRLFWLPEPNPYGQILYLGLRREKGSAKQSMTQSTQGAADLINVLTSRTHLLPEACAEPLPIPSLPRPMIRLRGREIDWDLFRQEAAQHGVDLVDSMVAPASLQSETVLPLKKGHLVSVLAGGGLDNARLGDDVIRGAVRQEEVEVETEDEEVVSLTQTVYHSQIVAFNPQTGEWKVFEEGNGLGDYMLDHATELTELVRSRFRPRYEFDMGAVPAPTRRIIHALATAREPVPGKPRGLWPGQRHVLAGLERSWAAHHPALIAVCEMGWGKSLLGAGAIAVNHAVVSGKPAWFVTEAHLVDQMVAEIKATWPLAHVARVDTIDEARYFLRTHELASEDLKTRRPWVAVVGKQKLKNGTGWTPAVVPIQRIRRPLGKLGAERLDDKDGPSVVTLYRCPDCGRFQVYHNGDNEGLLVVDDPDYFGQTPRTCCYEVTRSETRTERVGCGARLWQFSREIGGTDGKFQEGFARLGGGVVTYEGREAASTYGYRTRNGWAEATGYRPLRIIPPEPVEIRGKAVPGKVRWPLVRWLAKRHSDRVGTVVVDEVHSYKGQSTDAGYALGQLVGLADRALLMTGTLFGGRASSVFFLAHRASPAFRRRFKYTELQRFVERYGVLERKTVEKEYEVAHRGQTTLQTRRNTYVRELPGVSPALITLFLDFTLFSSLSDLGIRLPDVERRILPVRLDREHQRAYDAYRDDCIQAMKDAKEQSVTGEEIRLAGAFLHTLRGYAVAPWRAEHLRDKHGGIWASAPNLERVCPVCGKAAPVSSETGHRQGKECVGADRPPAHRPHAFAPERALLDEVKAQVARGRRVVVFVDQTRTRDIITPRLVPLCEAEGLQALFCDVEAGKRGAWIEKHAPFCDVMFVNPKAVETGLNLIQFATAIFFEIPYSLYVFKQAAARLRRPTQTQKVEIVYLNLADTIVAQALELMFEKLTASAIFRGESVEGTLGTVSGSGSFLAELMRRVVENARVDNLEAMFARYNRLEADNEGYFQDYDLSSYERVETISRCRTMVNVELVNGKQLQLL